MTDTVWKPQKKQIDFLARSEYEVLYGGAAGGGKSDALLVEALRQVHIPHYTALILRKTVPQLSELIDRSRQIYSVAFPGATYNSTEHVWRFPSGAKIHFGSMQYIKDRINYQGKRYDFIAFDELTHFTWEEYSYMFSRNRPSGAGTRVYIRATTNPGGVGHGWVKERFITPAPPLTPIADTYSIVTPSGEQVQMTRHRIFVPSTVFDNEILLKNNPEYLASLAMLPEAEKKALLYGDWDSFDGQVFTEWRNDPAHYDDMRYTHVVAPFRIPKNWQIYRGFDFGYTRPFSVGWYAADNDGRLFRIREYYGCTGRPNEGVCFEPSRIAEEIRKIEENDPNIKGRSVIGIADPSVFDGSRGRSVAEIMEKAGVYWRAGDNARISGKMQYHYRFAFDDEGVPMLYIFNTCKNFIRTVPSLCYDTLNVEDIDTSAEDHIYDECRYVLMHIPIKARETRKIIEGEIFSPLSSNKNKVKFLRM
ncbi:MAG: Terminase-like family protein [Ruminococcaceae bacterium]|nr:Terminase-like family protein [Oscillospiraceae bacterium]